MRRGRGRSGGTWVALALALGAAALGAGAPAGAAPEKSMLRLGLVVPAASFLPIYLAAERTAAEEGLALELVHLRGSSTLTQALSSGSVDIGVAGMVPLLTMIKAGHAMRTFYNSGVYHAEYEWFGASGLTTWAAVRGKRVGITTFGAQSHLLTRHLFRRYGLDADRDVQLVQVGGSPTAYQALKAGRIEVAMLTAPFKWKAAEDGFTRLGDEATAVGKEFPRNTFLTRTAFLDANPETIRALLRAHVRAIRLVRTDRDLAVQTLMRALKYPRDDAERAYAEVIGGLHERGDLPAQGMQTFWELAIAAGEVDAPWPESRFLDRRFIDTFDQWAPR